MLQNLFRHDVPFKQENTRDDYVQKEDATLELHVQTEGKENVQLQGRALGSLSKVIIGKFDFSFDFSR